MSNVHAVNTFAASALRTQRIRRVLWTILALNVGVALAKLGWGVVSGSVAMQADGFHSLFDGASNVVGLFGVGMASRPADRDHPYGHAKYETYASLAIGAMLALAAYNVGSNAIQNLMAGAEPPEVGAMSFTIMLVTLGINFAITTYERIVGRKLSSEILVADASHTASDVWVSIGVIAGLIAVRMGYPKADPIIALIVAFAIAFTAWRVFREATATLSDTARIAPADVCIAARTIDGVLGCHHVRTRGTEAEVYVDLHIQVDPVMTVKAGHDICIAVENHLCSVFESAVDVVVHLEPFDQYQASKTAEEVDAGLA